MSTTLAAGKSATDRLLAGDYITASGTGEVVLSFAGPQRVVQVSAAQTIGPYQADAEAAFNAGASSLTYTITRRTDQAKVLPAYYNPATGQLLDANGNVISVGGVAAVSAIIDLGSTTGATPIDMSLGDLVTMTVGANTTLSLINTPDLAEYKVLRLRVTNGGAFTLTLPTINWVGGAAPAWLASGTELAVLTVMNIGGSVVIDGAYVGQVV